MSLSLFLPFPPSALYSNFRLNSHLGRGGSPSLLTCPGCKIRRKGSLRRGTLRYSSECQWPNVDGQIPCLEFYWSSMESKLFSPLSPLNLHTTLLFLNLILYQSINKSFLANAVHPSNSLDPLGLDPGTSQWQRLWLILCLPEPCPHDWHIKDV